MESLLVARDVRKLYRSEGGEVVALDDVNLEVARGELVAVMGPSGSGKTTMLNCLSGLDDIDGGTVLVEGRDLFGMSDTERTMHRAQAMGFIFQAFNLIPVFDAVENVELPLLLRGTPPKDARARALQMLERVGLAHRARHRPNEMSGGEQQRVTVARALVGRPAIVWADEPTGNLDSTMARSVMELLRELNEEEEQTIVLVTHDAAIGASAGRIVRMRDGHLESDERQPTGAPVLIGS
ncbi:MAG TPA: ABC transporter ATP-binding protein [Acidimicrobiales bacterium]|nr:ABC transporter ATP-binding protein [Acidimicrobiales bacterium]